MVSCLVGLLATPVWATTIAPLLSQRSVGAYLEVLQSNPADTAYLTVMVSGLTFALIAGGGLARMLALLTGSVAVIVEIPIFVIDSPAELQFHTILYVGLLAVYASVALRSGPTWTLFLTAFHLLAVLGGLSVAFEPELSRTTALMVFRPWIYLSIATLAYGAWSDRRAAEAATQNGSE